MNRTIRGRFHFWSVPCYCMCIILVLTLTIPPSVGNAWQISDAPTVTLRFGMEIKPHSLGVEVADIKSDRAVSKKLHKGDILRSYELVSNQGVSHRITSGLTIDQLKEALARGETLLISLLRRKDSGESAFDAIQVIIDASDLMPPQTVEHSKAYRSTFTVGEPEPAPPKSVVLVPVFYATDRMLESNEYSGNRDNQSPNPIKYGACVVSIPPTHIRGQLEGPSFWRLEFMENPTKHIVLRTVSQIGKDATFQAIAAQFESLPTIPRKRVLVFVHGYNVAFDEAARRAAQMHYDLPFPGVTMIYSWPSDGTIRGYVADLSDVDWSVPHMKAFLADLEKQQVDDIYLVAHSMGNRGLTKALVELKRDGAGKKIKELILAAADVDADVFTTEIAPVLANIAPATVYVSSSDLALWSSETLSSTPRVGEIRDGEPTIPSTLRLNVIDVSTVKSDFVGHSAYGSASVITDISNVISGRPLPRDFLKSVVGSKGPYYEFVSTSELP